MATLTPELPTGGVEVDNATGWAVRESAVDLLQTAALPGLGEIYHRTSPDIRGLTPPCGIVAKARGAFSVQPGTVGRTDNRYSFYIVAVRSDQKGLDGSTDHARQTEVWLEQAARLFNGTRPALELPPGCCVIGSQVVDSDPRFVPAWLKQLDAIYLLVNVVVREPRPDA